MKPRVIVLPYPQKLEHDHLYTYQDELAREHYKRRQKQWRAMLKSPPPTPRVFTNRRGEIVGVAHWDSADGQLYESLIGMASHQPRPEDEGTDRELPGATVPRMLAFYAYNNPEITERWLLQALDMLVRLNAVVIAEGRVTLGPSTAKAYTEPVSCYCETCGQQVSKGGLALEQLRSANRTLAQAAQRRPI